jgi:hypothetical protein
MSVQVAVKQPVFRKLILGPYVVTACKYSAKESSMSQKILHPSLTDAGVEIYFRCVL